MSRAVSPEPVKLTLKEIAHYCDALASEYADHNSETAGTYERALREFQRYYARQRYFFFRRSDVEKYRVYLTEQRSMKNASVATYMTALRKLVQKLLDASVLQDDSALEVVGGERPKKHNRVFLHPPEIDLLLETVAGTEAADLRDNAIIRLMLSCGVAEQELVAADIEDIRTDGPEPQLRVQGKGRSTKDALVDVPPATFAVLKRYVEQRAADTTDRPLFTSFSGRSKGKRLTKRGLRMLLNARLEASGVKRNRDRILTPFSLRHTCGVLLVKAGCPEREIMRRMRIEWLYTARQYVTAAQMMKCDGQEARAYLGWVDETMQVS